MKAKLNWTFEKTSKRLTVDIFASLISIDVGSDIGPRSSLVKYTKHTSNCKKKRRVKTVKYEIYIVTIRKALYCDILLTGWNQSVILSA